MLYYLLIGIAGFLAILFLRFNRKHLYLLAERSLSLLNVLLNSEDDDVKLDQMQSATTRLLMSLLITIMLLVATALILYLPFIFESRITSSNDTKLSWQIVAVSIGASIPFFIPLPKSASGYSELSKLLHRLILNNYTLGLRLFRREARGVQRKGLKTNSKFVVISGLARAGTTSIMNQLSGLNEFRSLSYANMPFLLSPGLWSRVYRPKGIKLRERSHKDGVQIGLNSAEALEEYFFKAISNDGYLSEEHLREYNLKDDDYLQYLIYQRMICGDSERIYLAKNNNFLLRYHSIRQRNPEFIMVIMFRDPLYHAASLMEKHQEYLLQQEADPFVLEYMDWLGHHEFGQHQKAFAFKNATAPEGDRNSLDYWLSVWISYYEKALEIEDANTLFINYEDFCQNPSATISRILKKVNPEISPGDSAPFSNKRMVPADLDSPFLKRAGEIHDSLLSKA